MNSTSTMKESLLSSFTNGWSTSNLALNAGTKDAARKALESIDFPTTRNEHWKYTRLTKISKQHFNIAKEVASVQLNNRVLSSGPKMVFVNGLFSAELSSLEATKGIQFETLANNSTEWTSNVQLEGEVFNAMNSAYATDGVNLFVSKNTNSDAPLEVIFIQNGEHNTTQVRNKIVVEDNASAHLVMSFQSAEATDCFSNVVTEISVGKNAQFHMDKIQIENESSRHISTEQVTQDRDSRFTINTFTLDGLLTRNNLNVDVDGENCETNLNGVYLGKGNMHIDNHTIVDHKVPNCNSNELYKGVMDDKSTAVFNGKVFVRKDAQKINAFQSNGNVLMSDSATVNSKPELEIYADDVKCSHGSTTGQLDEEAIFYLRARGISEKAARKLMVSAFIGEALENHMPSEDVYNFVLAQLKKLYGWKF
jgi:Fe-S cluster assembly protein SufD